MSTNPFRRSSLKGPSGNSGPEGVPVASIPIDIPDAGFDTPTPVNSDNKASTTQKHVNFASPPAIPISPISYPSSPESTRFSPEYTFANPVLPGPTDYSQAIQSDPLRAEIGYDEHDSALAQALQNAKVNNELVMPEPAESKEDAVRNTLSRFASAPRKPVVSNRDSAPPQTPASHRQTMDVDAFKRLLLTGDSGGSRSEDGASATIQQSAHTINDSSSGTDTASISQRSLFDQGLVNEDSSRSSNEIDAEEADNIRQSIAPSGRADGKRKPPPPAPRHGKLIKEESTSEPYSDPASSQTSLASSIIKKAPTPPLARRHSQNNSVHRPSSSRQSSSSDIETATGPAESISNTGPKVAPPPPRSRRPISMMDRRSSSDLPITLEESESTDSSATASRKPSDSRPPPPPSRNSSKRTSLAAANAPPLPPPRRGRGSSRSSIDGQRPHVPAVHDVASTDLKSEQPLQSGMENRRVSSGTSATDILADLAALQREVDEARRKGSS